MIPGKSKQLMMKNSIIGGESSGRQLDDLVGHSGVFLP
jgi:hypothetical protein